MSTKLQPGSAELHQTKQAMRAFGGGFVNALVDLLDRADLPNQRIAMRAWPDIFEQYGPGTAFYRALTPKAREIPQ